MSNAEYESKIEHIYHMNALARSFNDEYSIGTWLTNGVPDGVNTIEELKDTYDNDEYFEDDYNELVALFAFLIQDDAKGGTDGMFA